MNLLSIAALLLIFFPRFEAWGGNTLYPQPRFSNSVLRFSYMPPREMKDKTQRFTEEIRKRAELSHSRGSLDALLAMSSGSDDKDANWHSLTIETYPRSAVSDKDDAKAEAQMSAWVAHSKDTSPAKSAIISGQRFSISLFGTQQGPIRKGAIVWTTIRKGQLLSFAFAANSPEQLTRLAKSMKTLLFF